MLRSANHQAQSTIVSDRIRSAPKDIIAQVGKSRTTPKSRRAHSDTAIASSLVQVDTASHTLDCDGTDAATSHFLLCCNRQTLLVVVDSAYDATDGAALEARGDDDRGLYTHDLETVGGPYCDSLVSECFRLGPWVDCWGITYSGMRRILVQR